MASRDFLVEIGTEELPSAAVLALSTALGEALVAMGKAVVATSTGSVPEMVVEGKTARLVAKGDAAAIDEVFGMLKAANAALGESVLMKELGSSQAQGGDEHDALVAKAAELRKVNPALSEEQAYAKAYLDPANRKLAAAERRKNRPAA